MYLLKVDVEGYCCAWYTHTHTLGMTPLGERSSLRRDLYHSHDTDTYAFEKTGTPNSSRRANGCRHPPKASFPRAVDTSDAAARWCPSIHQQLQQTWRRKYLCLQRSTREFTKRNIVESNGFILCLVQEQKRFSFIQNFTDWGNKKWIFKIFFYVTDVVWRIAEFLSGRNLWTGDKCEKICPSSGETSYYVFSKCLAQCFPSYFFFFLLLKEKDLDSNMADSCPVSLMNNSVLNESRGDCSDLVRKVRARWHNTATYRSEQRAIESFVEMALLFTTTLNYQRGTVPYQRGTVPLLPAA